MQSGQDPDQLAKVAPRGFGWRRDLPDRRDYSWNHPAIVDQLKRLVVRQAGDGVPGRQTGIEQYFPAVRDEGQLECGPSAACLGMIAYFERRVQPQASDRSILFLHQLANRIAEADDRPGVDLRTTFKTLRRCGAPPENVWPYRGDAVASAPTDPYLFAFAREFSNMQFAKLDDEDPEKILLRTKCCLAVGLPVVLGFEIGEQLLSNHPCIPDRDYDLSGPLRGQAVVASGYDDDFIAPCGRGALRIRNSWGPDWGDRGYGWLPYKFIRRGWATDFWIALKQEWIDAIAAATSNASHSAAGSRSPGNAASRQQS